MQDEHLVQSAYLMMAVTAWYIIVPLAFLSMLTGLVFALDTRWGSFRHDWILISFVHTVIAIVASWFNPHRSPPQRTSPQTRPPKALTTAGTRTSAPPRRGPVVLFVITALNVYKPGELTPHGRHTLQLQTGPTR